MYTIELHVFKVLLLILLILFQLLRHNVQINILCQVTCFNILLFMYTIIYNDTSWYKVRNLQHILNELFSLTIQLTENNR